MAAMVVLESEDKATTDPKLFIGRRTLIRDTIQGNSSRTIEVAHSVGHLALLSTKGNSRSILPSIALTVNQHIRTEVTATTMPPNDLQTSVDILTTKT